MDGTVEPENDIADMMTNLGRKARDASRILAGTSAAIKNTALIAAAKALRERYGIC